LKENRDLNAELILKLDKKKIKAGVHKTSSIKVAEAAKVVGI